MCAPKHIEKISNCSPGGPSKEKPNGNDVDKAKKADEKKESDTNKTQAA